MYAERHEVALVTNSSGAATGYTPVVTGRVLAVLYRKTDFADGVDLDVVTERTAQTIWSEDNVNASKDISPLRAAQASTGADITGAYVYPLAVAERIQIDVANGGDTTSGTVHVIIG